MEVSKGLGIPAPSCDTGVAWTENMLVPNSRWGDGGNNKTWDCATCSRPRFGSLDSWDDEQWL